MNVLRKRILTAVVLLPPLLGAVLYGKGWPFALLVGTVAVLCAGEYFRMFFSTARDRWSGVAVTGLVYLFGILLPFRAAGAAVLCGVALAAFHFLAGEESPVERARGAALAALGAVYIGGFLSTYPRTIDLPAGDRWILLGLVSVFAGDTFAYFVGKRFGKRPLSPKISPGKTVEGAVGGLAASIALGTGYGALFLPGVLPGFVSLASAVVGMAGQAGDLFESLLKRAAGVKDSGTLLPGHGGMFDRVDAVIAAGPVLYLLALLAPLAGGRG
ncbi:MAG TPA: phosphatidate cytidylyltransferase [Candidatus Deferrimicrobiaceae bacterium]|nr:phosphatidate cytidylyltransferase [Candidatus Deferrimicrobiaceae bacterium]